MLAKALTYLGVTVGFLGWLIGFTVVCLSTGNAVLLSEFAVPGAVLSLGLAAIAILVMDGFQRNGLQASPAFFTALWGLLAFDIGILAIYLNSRVAPAIDQHPEAAAAIERLGGTYRLNEAWVMISLAAGAFLLVLAALALALKKPANRP